MPFLKRIIRPVVALLVSVSASLAGAQEILVSCRDGDSVVALSTESSRLLAGGPGVASPGGLTFGSDGRLYVASGETARVLRLDRTSGQILDVFVEDERLAGVEKIAFGPDGGFYAAAPATDQVLRFDPELRVVDRIAAEGSGLEDPRGFAFGADGNLYVASFASNAVLRYDGATGVFLDVFATSGLAGPNDLTFGPDGELYVSSAFTGQVLRFDASTGALRDVFVNDPALSQAFGLAFGPDAGLYLASPASNELRVFDGATGAPSGILRASDELAPVSSAPRFLVFDRPEEALRVDPVRTPTVPIGFAVAGATPGGRVAVVFGTPAGETTLRECPGLRLEDINAVTAEIRVADGSGRVLLFGAPSSLGGESTLSVQTVDLRTCLPSDVLELTRP